MADPKCSLREAFEKHADPAWLAVPCDMKMFLDSSCVELAPLPYGAKFWPSGWLESKFLEVPASMLAGVTLVLSRWLLWHERSAYILEENDGALLKWLSYADKSLSERFGLPCEVGGVTLRVYEGLLRVEYAYESEYGGYRYLGLVTESLIKKAKVTPWPFRPEDDRHSISLWSSACRRYADDLAEKNRPRRGGVSLIFDSGAVEGFR